LPTNPIEEGEWCGNHYRKSKNYTR
jgi:hypothetical protein